MDANLLIAMVLTLGSQAVDTDAVTRAHAELAPQSPRLTLLERGAKATTWELSGVHAQVILSTVPVPVPGREAEEAAQFSLGTVVGRPIPSHDGHFIVALHGVADRPRRTSLLLMTGALAAIVKSTSATGVYWGDAGATHHRDFFLPLAASAEARMPIELWTGVSAIRDQSGRLSLLSLSVRSQFELPDLLLTAPWSESRAALERFSSFLIYTIERGKPLPDGDTIGFSATEKLRVRYVKSPIDDKQKVMQIDVK